jgi:hypothetical protein
MAYGSSPLEIMAADAMLKGDIYCQNFTYDAAFLTGTGTALAGPGTTDVPININADSDFLVQAVNLTAWSAVGTLIADPDYLLLLTVAGSGRQLMDRDISVQNMCGNFTSNKVPNVLQFPYLIQSNNSVTVRLTNRTNTAANRVDVSLIGFKIYYLAQAGRKEIFHVL